MYICINIYISINKCIYIYWVRFSDGRLSSGGYPRLLESLKILRPWHLGLISRLTTGLTNGLVLGRLGASWITKAIFLFDRLLGWTLDLGIQHSAYREIILREFVDSVDIFQQWCSTVSFHFAALLFGGRGTTGSVIEVDLTGELWPACPETRETRHLLIPKAVSDYGATLGRTPPSNSRIFSFDRCKLSAVSWSIRKGQQVGCRCLSVGGVF